MRTFDYATVPKSLGEVEITNLLLAIREYKGRQDYWRLAAPATLDALCESAKIQSIGSSNRIEGIVTTEKRLYGLVLEDITPRNRDEEEILGYRDVLGLIHEQHDFIPVTPGVILQLHRDLMGHVPVSFGGRWKDSDNEIVSRDAQGNTTVRFRPMPAALTPDAIFDLCEGYNRAYDAGVCDPLLLAARFVFDFVSIHPFIDGNGRMSRLLTVLLMERAGYEVGRYISIEHEIEKSKDQYYEALAASSQGWIEGENDEAPFVRYLLGVILGAYRKLDERMVGDRPSKSSKSDRVRMVFEHHAGRVTKAMIREECPDISEVTVKRALSELLRTGVIKKVGSGPTTGYLYQG